jgi:iron complex transport system permease protein
MFWTMGGLGFARWSQIGAPIAAILAGTAVLLLYGRTLNALATGDETATSLGIAVARTRLGLFAACAVVTGAAVAVSGAIGFVGLMVPHAVRGLVGADARRVLPVAAMLGAVFLVWVDIVARLTLAPQELPVGMVTAALGGVFFVWFMARRRA